MRTQLGLTADRIAKLNKLYQDRQKLMTPYKTLFDQETAQLEKMTAERVADDATFELKVSQVESLRSKLNESRTVMLYKMFRLLDAEQNRKLKAILERRVQARDGRGRGNSDNNNRR